MLDAKRIMHRLMRTRVSASLVAIMVAMVMAGAEVSAALLASAVPRGRGSHAGQRHSRRRTKPRGDCVTAKRRRTAHVAGAQPAHRPKPSKCKVARHQLKKRLVPTRTPGVSSVPVSTLPASPAPITAPLPAEALLPPLPAPPMNTARPVIAGSTAQGQVLGASSGSWTESPSSYTYRWQDCNIMGEGCTNVDGATASRYTLGSGDVGHTLRVTVTATNSGGVGAAASEHTAVIKEKGGSSTSCFGREEACGYPGPEDTGVEKGVTLTKHAGSLLVTKEGETIKDKKIEGNLEIAANNVTVENVEVVTYSQKMACEKEEGAEGSGGLQVQEHKGEISTGIVIKHVTVHGVTQSCTESLGNGVSIQQASAATDVKIEWSKVYWTGQCFRYSAWYENDYCDDNGELPAYGKVSNAHYDGVFDNGTGTLRAKPGLVIRHNTIIVPHWQTATMNLSNEEEVGEERIENNFLAGGGYLMYLPGANTKAGAPAVRGPVEVVGNRFARCSGKVVAGAFGHSLCEGLAGENETTDAPMTPDAHGYFPYGGGYGELYSSYNSEKDHFSGNYWDDNLEAAL
jgi:hypothetical protein